MKKYLAFFGIYWQSVMSYRFDTTVYALTELMIPFLGLFIWLSARSGNSSLAFNDSEIIFYFLAVAWCSNITNAWSARFITDEIKTGTISSYLVKPMTPLENAAINNLAEKAFKGVFISLAVTLGWYLLSLSYPLTLSITYHLIPFAFLALVCAMIMIILLDVCIGLAGFWLSETDFLINLYFMLDTLLTGRFIPITFLPPYLQMIGLYLPFRYVVSFPIEIVMGKLSTLEIIKGFILLTTWTVVFWLLQKILYKKGTKYYQSFGG